MVGRRFPSVRLETSRLVLRVFEAGDITAVAAGCADELTLRWLPLPKPYREEDARRWCLETAPGLLAAGQGINWALVERATGRLAGGFGLRDTNWMTLVTEVGYWVAPWSRGRGFATEAVREIGRWVLTEQGFERLELLAATGNRASQRVAEKAGFTREGVMRNCGITHAGRVDLVLYSLIKGED